MLGLAIGSFVVSIGVAITIKDAVDLAMIEQIAPLRQFTDTLVFLAFLGLLVGLPLRQLVARIGYHIEYPLRIWVYEKLPAMHPPVLDVIASGQARTAGAGAGMTGVRSTRKVEGCVETTTTRTTARMAMPMRIFTSMVVFSD